MKYCLGGRQKICVCVRTHIWVLWEGRVWGAWLCVRTELVVGELRVKYHRVTVCFWAVGIGDCDGESMWWTLSLQWVVWSRRNGYCHRSIGWGEKASLVLNVLVPWKNDIYSFQKLDSVLRRWHLESGHQVSAGKCKWKCKNKIYNIKCLKNILHDLQTTDKYRRYTFNWNKNCSSSQNVQNARLLKININLSCINLIPKIN